eukprot:896719_1
MKGGISAGTFVNLAIKTQVQPKGGRASTARAIERTGLLGIRHEIVEAEEQRESKGPKTPSPPRTTRGWDSSGYTTQRSQAADSNDEPVITPQLSGTTPAGGALRIPRGGAFILSSREG